MINPKGAISISVPVVVARYIVELLVFFANYFRLQWVNFFLKKNGWYIDFVPNSESEMRHTKTGRNEP